MSFTLNVTLITLSDIASFSSTNYSLTGGEIQYFSNSSGFLELTVSLTRNDVRELKISQQIATSRYDTFLTLSGDTIKDTSFSPNTPIDFQRVSLFILDTTPSEVEAFSLDLNIGILHLTFNDVMDISSFNPNGLHLQNSVFSTLDSSYTLTQSYALNQDGYIMDIILSKYDKDNIFFIPHLASLLNLTFITYDAKLIDDIFGTNVLALTNGNAKFASNFIPDTNRPQLVEFDFDINHSLLILYFSEAIDLETLKTEMLLISASNNSLISLQLVESIDSTYLNVTTLLVYLPIELANLLKLDPLLATSIDNTFLSITNQTVRDFAGNLIMPISISNPKQVRNYLPDIIKPELIQFEFDNNQGNLNLYDVIIVR